MGLENDTRPLAELCKIQEQTYAEFKRIKENDRKEGSRRTLEYVEKKWELLGKYWEEFQIIDGDIQNHEDFTNECEYVANNIYENAENIVIQMNELFKKYSDDFKEIAIKQSSTGKLTRAQYKIGPVKTITINDNDNENKSASQAIQYQSRNFQSDSETYAQTIRLRKLSIKIASVERLMEKIKNAFSQVGITRAICAQYRKELEYAWNSVNALNEDIDAYATEEDYNQEYFQNNIYDNLLCEVDSILLQICKKEDELVTKTENEIRLPTINIPTFDGDYNAWSSFRDLYTRMIHTNSKLCKAEKLQFLKTRLRGEAAKLIQHLECADINYDAAWNAIIDRYDNTRLIVTNQLDKFLNLDILTTESADGVKKLYDSTNEMLHTLKNLKIDTSTWSPILVHILMKKLDRESIKAYEHAIKNPRDIQELSECLQFLQTRFRSLESIASNQIKQCNNYNVRKNLQQKTAVSGFHAKMDKPGNIKCVICEEQHTIYRCKTFNDMEIQKRWNAIKSANLCSNCLNHDKSQKCYSNKKCLKCKKSHHTSLHNDGYNQRADRSNKKTYNDERSENGISSHVAARNKNILLATALIKAKNAKGSYDYLRALIDTGAQASFITLEAAQALALPIMPHKIAISGLGSTDAGISKGKVNIQFGDRFQTRDMVNGEFLILPKLTRTLPNKEVKSINLNEWKNYCLADPTFNRPGPIDVILGADIYPMIARSEIKQINRELTAQNTNLGWVFIGEAEKKLLSNQEDVIAMVSYEELDQQLERFWEVEEVEEKFNISASNEECEKLYKETYYRNENGTYVVKLPFKEDPETLGVSKKKAFARFHQLENRFNNDKELAEGYKRFMTEYINLGHMTLVSEKVEPKNSYYIPHQAVFKEDSTTTKLRVVFDASAKTTSGKSLNDLMHAGPRLQQDLTDILLRWRKHQYVFSADIEKMYRQIRVEESQHDYQRVLWRFRKMDPIQTYRLTTVTYGTTAAPYLAVRTLQQLAVDERDNYVKASDVVLRDAYVDDILSGAETLNEAKELQIQLIQLMKKGGLNLRKWKANTPDLTNHLPAEQIETGFTDIKENETVKTLGVHWCPKRDSFQFKVNIEEDTNNPTKRSILSIISKLYDPLGWLAPVTILAKLLMQKLWKQELKWDTPVGSDILKIWSIFRKNLKYVEKFEVPRWMGFMKTIDIELHGYCDASERAYGAVIYSRIITDTGIKVTLLVSKSKVAPIKLKKTLPRLELCAANLLAKMISRTRRALELESVTTYAWSDSMITLAWIKGNTERWKTFVANRVSEIKSMLSPNQWRHVKSADNPADAISRGVEPDKLTKLWWTGPQWLIGEPTWRQNIYNQFETSEEEKKQRVQVMSAGLDVEHVAGSFQNMSSITKLIRTIARCKRCKPSFKGLRSNTISPLEMQQALTEIIKIIQIAAFENDINDLRSKSSLQRKSKLLSLNPFIDNEGILRVGGRLENSSLSYEEKHPIILPHNEHVTELIIIQAHCVTLHGGFKLTISYLRRKYWIPHYRNTIKKILHKCMKCRKIQAQSMQQIMGNLPVERVTPARPFTHSGVDFAGPIQIRTTKGRGHKAYKGYIVVIVCLSTKAVHLEIVSDMTTNAFMAAFKRFVSRRGACLHMYSDNGTTFVGAKTILEKEIYLLLKQNSNILDELATYGTQWHFIPPAAPHFGGIWEAAVKSMKYHLKRVIGDTKLTYEELTTVIYQIEACLNSRPLCEISTDPLDFTPLTPGHFLIGTELISPTLSSDLQLNDGLVTRWKLLQKMTNDFWKTWKVDYLSQLQQRTKWKEVQENIRKDELVLIKDDNLPSTKWSLGRVMETHRGKDDKIRVVTLKTAKTGALKRPITKICPLPFQQKDLSTEEEDKETGNQRPTNVKASGAFAPASTILKLAVILIIIFGTICESSGSYILKKPEPGLYIEDIGNAQIKRGILRIELSYSFDDIRQDQANMGEVITTLDKLCKNITTMSGSSHCTDMIHHLVKQNQSITNQIQYILDEQKRIRNQRGLLGTLMQSIFGVNDEVYTDIEKLDKNQRQVIQATKHQTSVMVSTIAHMNETEVRITEKLNHFAKKLNEGYKSIAQMQGWFGAIDKYELNIHFLTLYELAKTFIEEHKQKYDKILMAYFKKGNIIDMLTAQEIRNLTIEAENKLPNHLKIIHVPINVLDCISTNNEITIYGYLHIGESTQFDMVRVTPIPRRIENATFLIAMVPSSIIAVDYNSLLYFELTDAEFERSITLQETSYLCTPPMIYHMNTRRNCVIDAIYQRPNPIECELHKLIIANVLWKQLYAKNTWLAIVNTPTTTAIVCNGIRNEMMLNESYILFITPQCLIETKFTVLSPTITQDVNMVTTFNKPLMLDANISIPQSRVHHLKPESMVPVSGSFLQHTKEDEDTIHQQLEMVQWERIQHHHIVTISSWTVTSILILVLICSIIWVRRRRRSTYSGPTPV